MSNPECVECGHSLFCHQMAQEHYGALTATKDSCRVCDCRKFKSVIGGLSEKEKEDRSKFSLLKRVVRKWCSRTSRIWETARTNI